MAGITDADYNQLQNRRGNHDARDRDQDGQGNRNRSQIKRRHFAIANPTQKKIQSDNSQAERWHIRHEGAPGKDVQWRKSVEKRSPNRSSAAEDLAHEQKEKWERDSEENHGLAATNPFVNTGKFVIDRREKR